jgi:hypothetical protein
MESRSSRLRKIQKKVSGAAFESIRSPGSIFILVSCIIIALVIDVSIVKVVAFTGGLDSPALDLAVFTTICLVFSLGQYLILRFVRRTNEQNNLYKRLQVAEIHKSISIIQYVLIGILASIIWQIVFMSSYNILFLDLIVCISYLAGLAVLGFLTYRLLLWFKSSHSIAVLSYSVAIMAISINAIFTVLYVTNEIPGKPANITPSVAFVGSYSFGDIFTEGYITSYIASFTLTWAATVLFLRNYSRKLGRSKYWLLVSIPLLYFLSQFGYEFLGIFTSFRISHPILFGSVYSLFFSGTVPAGGVLFGIAFWIMARRITANVVKQYLMISAFGMMIIFSANQPSALVRFFYPPFGAVTLSFFGLSSYLILIGIYSSAMSVAQDSELRRSIRKSAKYETNILGEIGTSQMEHEIERRVLTIAKRNQEKMAQDTGIQSSFSEDDMKEYLVQVLQEVGKQKTRSTNGAT